MITLPFDIPEIRQGLGICGIDGQLRVERLFRPVVLLSLPIEIAEPKMNVGQARGDLGGRLELLDGFLNSTQAIKGLASENVRFGGIRIVQQEESKLFESAGIVLRPQTALRQDLVQLRVLRLCRRQGSQHLRSKGEFSGAVIAHS